MQFLADEVKQSWSGWVTGPNVCSCQQKSISCRSRIWIKSCSGWCNKAPTVHLCKSKIHRFPLLQRKSLYQAHTMTTKLSMKENTKCLQNITVLPVSQTRLDSYFWKKICPVHYRVFGCTFFPPALFLWGILFTLSIPCSLISIPSLLQPKDELELAWAPWLFSNSVISTCGTEENWSVERINAHP